MSNQEDELRRILDQIIYYLTVLRNGQHTENTNYDQWMVYLNGIHEAIPKLKRLLIYFKNKQLNVKRDI